MSTSPTNNSLREPLLNGIKKLYEEQKKEQENQPQQNTEQSARETNEDLDMTNDKVEEYKICEDTKCTNVFFIQNRQTFIVQDNINKTLSEYEFYTNKLKRKRDYDNDSSYVSIVNNNSMIAWVASKNVYLSDIDNFFDTGNFKSIKFENKINFLGYNRNRITFVEIINTQSYITTRQFNQLLSQANKQEFDINIDYYPVSQVKYDTKKEYMQL